MKASSEKSALPLVGNAAPDFKATAVFDQEFVDVTLSQYKVHERMMMKSGVGKRRKILRIAWKT